MSSRIFYIFALLCFYAPGKAQLLPPEVLTIENGLSQGMVYCIMQSKDGFLWIGTKDGLNRYDGYNFKQWTSAPFVANSLSDNTITSLFEDSRGLIWIGTESSGVDLYDRKTNKFYHLPLKCNINIPNQSCEVVEFSESNDGNIWVLQRAGGIIKITLPPNREQAFTGLEDLSSVISPVIYSIENSSEAMINFEIKDDKTIILATSKRQYFISIADKSFQSKEYPFPTNEVFHLIFDKGKNGSTYWAVTKEAFYYQKNGRTTRLPLPAGEFDDLAMIFKDATGTIWLTVKKKLYKLENGNLPPNLNHPDWVMDEVPASLCTDKNGNIWVGTQGYGLRKFNPRKKLFHPGAKGKSIWGIWCDSKGKYICKIINKMYPYDPVADRIVDEKIFKGAPDRLFDLEMESNGELWTIGRMDENEKEGILYHLDADRNLLKSWKFPFQSYFYAQMMRTRDGVFWITSSNSTLISFNPADEQFSFFNYAGILGENASTIKVNAMAEDGNGTIWLGTQQGIIKCIRQNNTLEYQYIKSDINHPEGLTHNVIGCLLPDPTHPETTLWIGTKGGGINKMDLRTGNIQKITTREGLSNNVIYGILPDKENNLWCSTNRGLVKLTPDTSTSDSQKFKITTFTAANGLQDNEFNTQSYSLSASGEMLFAGVNGFNHFYPEAIALDTTPPPVFVVGIAINHLPIPETNTLVERLTLLEVNYNENNISFEFAALDFTDPSQNIYQYRLVGLDRDWVKAGSTRFAHFSQLSPGTYRFKVRASNGKGRWSEAEQEIMLIVHPPWWRSWYAYLAYLGLLTWIGCLIYRFRNRRTQMRGQLRYEQEESEKARNIEQIKTRFFANVTHEFRTPLTLMLEPLRQILEQSKDPELKEKLSLVDRSGKRLLGMVNQLLDLAKLEHGGMQLQVNAGDLVVSVHHAFLPFLTLAEKKDIELRFKKPDHPIHTLFDTEKLELILNNLLGNALKFTPEGGKIEVTLTIKQEAQTRVAHITVRDNGCGISPGALPRIFDRFYQEETPENTATNGTGIGLALSRDLARLMGGDISVESTPGLETSFLLWFPIIDLSGAEWSKNNSVLLQTKDLRESTNEIAEISPYRKESLPVVVIAEDNADIRKLLRLSLRDKWRVVEAVDGDDGVNKIISLIPDLVISDLMMPGKDGFELCQIIKTNEMTAHIPIILLSARSNADTRLEGLRIGADDYITKPFSAAELLVRMENLLENRRNLRQIFSQSVSIESGNEDKPFLSIPDNEFLRRFTLVLEENLGREDLGVEDFATKMFVSRVQLHRKLKGLTGQSATEFIRDYRLNRAYGLLKNGEGLVGEIAAKVGFANEKYFSTVFKEKFKASPRDILPNR